MNGFPNLAEGETQIVRVVEPCGCIACKDGSPWFMCRDPREIARYEVASSRAIKIIRELHPGKDLVY
ncbi:MAG: hypothetical protein LAP85_21895 [Acidobacteriia bacterium]|nr:hypothetical protein [Terriglobia bacterium]